MAGKIDWDQFPDANTPAQKGGIDWDQFPDAQPHQQGAVEQFARNTVNELPVIGGVIGGALGTPLDAVSGPAGTVVGAGIGGYLGTATKNLINRYIDPNSAPQNNTDAIVQPFIGGANQAVAQGAGEGVAPYLGKAIQTVADPVSDALKSLAANKAIASTGATGAQSLKFAPEAGQELLDQGLVKFGNSQSTVAKKITAKLDKTGENIGNIISDLDKRGATVDHADIVSSLRARATELGEDPSQYGVSDSLNKLADRIQSQIEANGGKSTFGIAKAEGTKRGFQASANYNSSPLDLSTAKEAANIYRQAVEDAATKFDPDAASAFTEAKKTYGLLNPIQEAAAKRAATLNQSPHGGLLDTMTTIAGEGLGGVPGAIVAPIARRMVSSRIAPAIAASSNSASKLLGAVPSAVESSVPALIQGKVSASPSMSALPDVAMVPAAAAQSDPSQLKGEDKWASNGLNKLGIDDQSLLQDKKARQLLIEASDLPANSKRLQAIKNQLSKGMGNK